VVFEAVTSSIDHGIGDPHGLRFRPAGATSSPRRTLSALAGSGQCEAHPGFPRSRRTIHAASSWGKTGVCGCPQRRRRERDCTDLSGGARSRGKKTGPSTHHGSLRLRVATVMGLWSNDRHFAYGTQVPRPRTRTSGDRKPCSRRWRRAPQRLTRHPRPAGFPKPSPGCARAKRVNRSAKRILGARAIQFSGSEQ
jgi:hypothetical protein